MPTAGNGIAVQAGDARQQDDAALAVLAGKKARQQAARAFVRSSDEAIEGTMLSGDSAFGILLASRTLTSVDEPLRLPGSQAFLLGHRTLPPFGQVAEGARLLYSLIAEVIVEQ